MEKIVIELSDLERDKVIKLGELWNCSIPKVIKIMIKEYMSKGKHASA